MLSLPELRSTPPDREMLLALDILLALRPGRLLRVSLQPPYRLCFLTQRADGWIDYFAVMPVSVGHESRISQLLQVERRRIYCAAIIAYSSAGAGTSPCATGTSVRGTL